MTLAFNTKHPHVRTGDRWVASLSDGTTVFEDITPGDRTAWRRLSDYVKTQNLLVTMLRLEYGGKRIELIPYKDAEGNPQIRGYWQARKMMKFVSGGLTIELQARGIGYVSGDNICITWVAQDGQVRAEVRAFDPTKEGAILNDEIQVGDNPEG